MYFRDMLAKNPLAFCLSPENLSDMDGKSGEVSSLSDEI